MKNFKSAFTIIEFLIVITTLFLFAAILIPSWNVDKHKSEKIRHKQELEQKSAEAVAFAFQVGDLVYIDGLSVTGKVNSIHGDMVDLLTKSTNDVLTLQPNINGALLKKVTPANTWKY
jgi:type II secretory pathway pseudopilin PulG